MEILGLDPIQAVLLIGLVSGGTELVKRLFAKDWKAASVIAVAALVGGLGSFLVEVPVVVGVVAGLATSGYITIAQNFGKK